jgi:hypothetical protein
MSIARRSIAATTISAACCAVRVTASGGAADQKTLEMPKPVPGRYPGGT